MTTDIDRARAAHLTRHARTALTVPRPVVVLPCLERAEALAAAPCLEDGRFRLPPISST
ncbi:hypothetical protein [Actinomycetospora sp. NBC_00405]|uniref:hypothetical protein n=1 Tax=Actinomycetospora sp. NBC_00405 TaxID=2975952 RepID=UPI002E1F66A1